jgi:hypothetical protein
MHLEDTFAHRDRKHGSLNLRCNKENETFARYEGDKYPRLCARSVVYGWTRANDIGQE